MSKTDGKRIVASLNRMLSHAHACVIRYATHAVLVGPYSEDLSARLRGIASDKVVHARKLRERIACLGGTPTTGTQSGDFKPALRPAEILDLNIAEERSAIGTCRRILDGIPRVNIVLSEMVRDILVKEREHLEELENLRPAGSYAGGRAGLL